MIKKLSKRGDEFVLVLDRSMLEQLKIDEETALEVMVDGGALVVAPVENARRRRRFEEALAATNERYGETLRQLAE